MRRHEPQKGFDGPPRRRFSQNFLVDRAVAGRIVAAFSPGPEDHVIEVGPGRGVLTDLLVGRVERLIVVEIDRDLAGALAAHLPDLDVRSTDILEQPLAELRSGPPLRLLSNLPYAISSPFLTKLTDEIDTVTDATLLLQLEFAERLAADLGSKQYGALTVAIQLYFDVNLRFEVGPGAFRPRPRVRSSLVRLTPRPVDRRPPLALRPRLRRILRAAFSARRKRLDRGLSGGLGLDREAVRAELAAYGLDPELRPERIEPQAFAQLATGPLGDPPS